MEQQDAMSGAQWFSNLWVIGAVLLSIAAVLALYRRRWRAAAAAPDDVASQADPADTSFPGGATADPDLFEHAPIGLCQLDLSGRVMRANAFVRTLLGMSFETLHAQDFSGLLHVEDRDRCRLERRELLAKRGRHYESELRLCNRDGDVLWVRRSLRLLRDGRGRPRCFVAAIVDISAQKHADSLHRLQAEKLQTLVDHMPVAVWLTAADDTRVLFANDAFEAVWGYSRDMFYADPGSLTQRIHPDDVDTVQRSTATSAYDISYRIRRDDGELRYVRDMGRGIFDSHGRVLYRLHSVADISGEKRLRDELSAANEQLREANRRWQENARLDSLTRCLNRNAFFEEVEKALQLEQRYRRSSTLVFFDLNDFKDVNDNFGHHVGDRGLIAFVEHIRTRLRTTDELGRYGGDEFVALLRETDALQARLLLASLTPVVVDAENGSSVILRFSAGVSCSDDPAIETVDDWIRIADSQMYYQRARRNGR